MELKVNVAQVPQITSNFDEIRELVKSKVEIYKSMVYSEDDIKNAKEDRAKLNKLADAIDTKRKEVKKECLKPFEAFEAQAKELVAIVREPVALIGEQILAFEEKEKEAKKEQIKEAWEALPGRPDWLKCNQIFDPSWLNKTTSMKKVTEAIAARLAEIDTAIKTLEQIEAFGFEAVEEYKTHLDMNRAIESAKRMAEVAKAKEEEKARRAAAEAVAENAKVAAEQAAQSEPQKAEEPQEQSEPPHEQIEKKWLSFRALLDVADAKRLAEFMKFHEIKFEKI